MIHSSETYWIMSFNVILHEKYVTVLQHNILRTNTDTTLLENVYQTYILPVA